eukprot:819728-Amphidinium_carterae.2
MSHPTRGVLATLLAAHYVSWVEKNEEKALQRLPLLSLQRRCTATPGVLVILFQSYLHFENID